MALEISSEITDERAIIRIEGEVDVSNASRASRCFECRARRWSKRVEADFAGKLILIRRALVLSGCRIEHKSGSVLVVQILRKTELIFRSWSVRP